MELTEQPRPTASVNPKLFILILFIASSIMLFAALTSAYLVKQADGNKLDIELPAVFLISTCIIILSSVSMHWSFMAAKKNRTGEAKTGLVLTIILGVTFLVSQFMGWGDLVAMNVHFVGNASGSFLYVLSGVHGFHLISGLIFLLIVLIAVFRNKVHAGKMLPITLCMIYWHFLGALWVYLFLFLKAFS